ncbi:ADP-ribosylation_factor 1 [Hexamita inflata]|uniref:ADP-ribosylation factor 1 n=1 Tax=Hexamita inflata TaxID=28002 RepID=A0AA86PDD7_9EUKA|nr:ADP-ribosylation factor 1 [Hexamita inflata]
MNFCFKCKILQDVRALLLGLDNSGKTSLLYQWRLHELVTAIPTIGFNVESIRRKKLSVHIWDVGGQQKIRKLWKHHLLYINVILFVIDSTEPDFNRIYEAKSELNILLMHEDLIDVPFLILFNKSDLEISFTDEEIFDEFDFRIGETEIQTNSVHKVKVMRTSALSSENLTEILNWIEFVTKKKQK